MRGEASRTADRISRDSLAPKLRESGDEAWQIGNELFYFTNLLDHDADLERALTDPAREVADKVKLLDALLGKQAHPVTMEILKDVVGRKWSRVSDIANAVEDFAVDAMMYYADATGVIGEVSVELAQLHSALISLPVVRSKLYDSSVPAQARVTLLRSVLSGNDFNKITVRLAEHATYNLRNRRYLETIQWLIGKISRHMGESMITVTTAKPLTQTQIDKLAEVYSAKLNHYVHINSVVDPSVLGGMRVQVGETVTDSTVVAQLKHLERTVKLGS